eukprot:14436184-Alexandrium_andersonii.AAC.1
MSHASPAEDVTASPLREQGWTRGIGNLNEPFGLELQCLMIARARPPTQQSRGQGKDTKLCAVTSSPRTASEQFHAHMQQGAGSAMTDVQQGCLSAHEHLSA